MTYTFGVFEFDESSLELRRNGRLVALEPQPAKALALLVARAGEVVTREELAAHVWGSGTHVDFNRGLAYCLGQIRSALGDSGDNPRFVQTLPKRGFRFLVEPARTSVSRAPNPAPSALPSNAEAHIVPGMESTLPPPLSIWILVAAVAVMAIIVAAIGFGFRESRRPVVAVSIFDNETGAPEYDRPVHAMADTVVHRLTALGPNRVGIVGNESILRMPRSARDLRRIEEETGATHVVLAQLQQGKGGLVLIVHLIRLDDGTHLWTKRLHRPAGDGLAGLGDEAAQLLEGGLLAHVVQKDS